MDHFKYLFSYPQGLNLMDQMNTIQKFPHFFEEEECLFVDRSVTISEVKNNLNMYVIDKSPGHDGWTVEFCSHFF